MPVFQAACAWSATSSIASSPTKSAGAWRSVAVVRLIFLRVLDTWYMAGVRGDGRHDFEVTNAFVPLNDSVWFADPPAERGALYSMPAIALFATLIASVLLGIACHALEVFKE